MGKESSDSNYKHTDEIPCHRYVSIENSLKVSMRHCTGNQRKGPLLSTFVSCELCVCLYEVLLILKL